MKPLVTIHDLRVRLGEADILRGVNAHIARGQITALIGLNGSGKTTLLRALLHEIPFGGSFQFHCGHDHQHPRPDQVGYVPQRLRIEAHLPLTVQDLFALALQKRPLFLGIRKALRTRMEAMLGRVGVNAHILTRPFDRLSGGEQQRVLLALALEPDPELLLLDEPASGVDFKDQESFYDLIARFNRERKVTILLVSHDLSVVSRHAQHVLCLKDGAIQCEGPPEVIMSQEALKETFGKEMAVFHHHHHPASK